MASPSKNILPHLRQPVVGMPSPTGNMPQSLQHNTSLPVTVALPDTVESLKLQCKYLEKQCTMLTRELDDLKETERSDEVDFIKMRRSVNNIDFTSLKEYYEHQLEQFGIKCEELERKKTELQTKNRSQDTTIKRLDADFVLHAIQYTKLKERFDAEVDKNVTQKVWHEAVCGDCVGVFWQSTASITSCLAHLLLKTIFSVLYAFGNLLLYLQCPWRDDLSRKNADMKCIEPQNWCGQKMWYITEASG